MLYMAMIAAMGASFLSSLITTRVLGPAGYGDVKFIQTIWTLTTLLAMAGYQHTGSFVLLKEKDQRSGREIIGTIIVWAVGTGVFIGLFCALAAHPIDRIFGTDLARLLIVMSPFAIVMPLQSALLLVYQSTNQIYRLAFLNTLPVLLYLLSVLVLPEAWVSTGTILFLQQITIFVVVAGLVVAAKPRFASMRKWGGEIRKAHRSYGTPIYVGSVAAVATGQLNRLAISYWVDNTAVGFYSLASTLTEPLKMIPGVVGTSSFKEFANQRHISAKVTRATIVASALALVVAFVFLGKPLEWLYTEAFAAVSPMARVAAFGAVLYGFGDFYNRFMGAHGRGAALRNTALMVGAVNVLGFFIFVPLWGAWGAIAANLVVGFVYPGVMYWHYRKYTRSLDAAAAPLALGPAD
jgi:O-antigen/teichoic acid export membrane protein